MNKISYKFTKEGGLTPSWLGGYELIIDDRKTGDYLDISGFVLSAEKTGVFPVFVGACGAMGCCGVYVKVQHEKDKVVWEKFWRGNCGGIPNPEHGLKEFKFFEDFIVKPPLVFDRGEYKKLAKGLGSVL